MPKIVTTKEKLQINTMTLALVGVQAITHKIETEDLKKVFDRVSLIMSLATDCIRDIDSLTDESYQDIKKRITHCVDCKNFNQCHSFQDSAMMSNCLNFKEKEER